MAEPSSVRSGGVQEIARERVNLAAFKFIDSVAVDRSASMAPLWKTCKEIFTAEEKCNKIVWCDTNHRRRRFGGRNRSALLLLFEEVRRLGRELLQLVG